MRSTSLLVKDNLQNPLLALPQPRASVRAEEKKQVRLRQRTRHRRGVKRRSREETRIRRKRKRFATIQLSTTEFLEKGDPRQERVLQERKNTQHASFLFFFEPSSLSLRLTPKGMVQWRMPVITCVPFIKKKGNCKLGFWCTLKHTGKAGSEPKKRHDSVVVAKTSDHTHVQEVTSLKFKAQGDLLHGVSAVPVKYVF